MEPLFILGKRARRRSWGWTWESGCVAVEIADPAPRAVDRSLRVTVFIYAEPIVMAVESSPARAAAAVTRKLRQILNCLLKVV